jgi:DNA-directed RNA polymerase sigma subunit (sigma70/sigma32)
MTEVINKLGRIHRELLQDLGREPTPEELATQMDVTPDKVLELQHYARVPITLDQTLGDDGAATMPTKLAELSASSMTRVHRHLQRRSTDYGRVDLLKHPAGSTEVRRRTR